jgi:formate/nitrite transporter FocA (FNT family)
MTTTITMKLIMVVFMLMNFSGLIINLTLPRVMALLADLLQAHQECNELAAQVARVKAEQAQLASLLDTVLSNSEVCTPTPHVSTYSSFDLTSA